MRRSRTLLRGGDRLVRGRGCEAGLSEGLLCRLSGSAIVSTLVGETGMLLTSDVYSTSGPTWSS